jgi:hypothetical protein
MGLWPVNRWQPNMIIQNAHELLIPPGTPPGSYQLEVGLYDATTGQPLTATGQPVGAGGGLLLGDVSVAWQALSTKIVLPHSTKIRLAPNAILTGYDIPPSTATTGDIIPINLAWQESQTFDTWLMTPFNDNVVFEWQQHGQPIAEQFIPLPLPIQQWGYNAVMQTHHELIVPPTLTPGSYEVVVMLHDGSSPAGERFLLGTVQVATPPHQFELPASATVPVQLGDNIDLVGHELEFNPDESLSLRLYWRTNAPITTRYKIFAQLLTSDNQVIAQSDNFPARPTTGWLPQEIITDSHTLTIPPTGIYRLIVGFYNPRTGERLSRHDGGDFITVDEIKLQ